MRAFQRLSLRLVEGIASLHDFFPKHYSHPGSYVKRDLKTGKYTVLHPGPTQGQSERIPTMKDGKIQMEPGQFSGKSNVGTVTPELGYIDASTGYQREELSPL